MRSPTQRITFTHIEFPHARCRLASGGCGRPRHGMSVQPSGSPMNLSDSTGTSRLSCPWAHTALTWRNRSVYIAEPASS